MVVMLIHLQENRDALDDIEEDEAYHVLKVDSFYHTFYIATTQLNGCASG